MLRIAEFSQRSLALKESVSRAFSEAGIEYKSDETNQETIRLVFAGQYSAGKSTILKMLTGREDIEIGAGITTQTAHSYNWNGLEVVDTPGIHTTLRPDHDAISYEAIASADMLVFVITNELFDSYVAEHFRKLAIDKDKAGEMILVVNKMERAADGNSDAQRSVIREDLRSVVAPYTPEQLFLSFLDAESYVDGIAEADADAELAQELIQRSGYNEFIETLDRFVAQKKVSAKITTDLYKVDEQLEKAIKCLQPQSMDADIKGLEESLLQQRHVFIDARYQLQREIKGIFDKAAAEVREYGSDTADLIVKGCDQEKVEEALQTAYCKAMNVINEAQNRAVTTLDGQLNEIGKSLDDIEVLPFSEQLKSNLLVRMDSMPEGVKKIVKGLAPGLKKAGKEVLKHAYAPGVEGGLKLTSFSGSKIHQILLKGGEAVGYKFKPWQAVKFTRGIAVGGQILGVFGIGLEVFMQIKSEQDEEKIRDEIKTNRRIICGRFNDEAKRFEEFADSFIEERITAPLSEAISEIDSSIKEIRNTQMNRSRLCQRMEELQSECSCLIRDIHTLGMTEGQD